jgi:signal transduction histidine kinase
MHDAQSKFLVDIAHEFQTPIAILKGNLETIAENGSSREKHAFYVADTTLDRLSRLVANLLDVARLQFSKEKFEKQSVNVKALIEAAYDDCETLAEHHKISLSYASEDIFVCGDKEKLKEVLLNLISNALKHTPAGGSISLVAKKSGEEAEISVADTGRGITPENLSLIFERFYQIGGERNRRGAGIGLHICRQIVEAHHGTVTAESDFGKGSRFIVHLPLTQLTDKPKTVETCYN